MVIKITPKHRVPVKSVNRKGIKSSQLFGMAMDKAQHRDSSARVSNSTLGEKLAEEQTSEDELAPIKESISELNARPSELLSVNPSQLVSLNAEGVSLVKVNAIQHTQKVNSGIAKTLAEISVPGPLGSAKKALVEKPNSEVELATGVLFSGQAPLGSNGVQKVEVKTFGSTMPVIQMQELMALVDRLAAINKTGDAKWTFSLSDSAHGFEQLTLRKTADNQWSVHVTMRADVHASLAQQDLQRLRSELQRRGHKVKTVTAADKEEDRER